MTSDEYARQLLDHKLEQAMDNHERINALPPAERNAAIVATIAAADFFFCMWPIAAAKWDVRVIQMCEARMAERAKWSPPANVDAILCWSAEEAEYIHLLFQVSERRQSAAQ